MEAQYFSVLTTYASHYLVKNLKTLLLEQDLKQGFKLHADHLSIFFPSPCLWHIMSMLDHHRHGPLWIKDQKLISYSFPANSRYSSKNSSIPKQIATKYLQNISVKNRTQSTHKSHMSSNHKHIT